MIEVKHISKDFVSQKKVSDISYGTKIYESAGN